MVKPENEEKIEISRSILGSSYDLASGGIPPHASMLESLVIEKPLTEYQERTFLALAASNLLSIPGITLYLTPENKEEAVAYFGEEVIKEMAGKKRAISKLAAEGGAANIRYFWTHDSSLNLTPISVKEVLLLLQHCKQEGYLSKQPKQPEQRVIKRTPEDLDDLMFFIINNNGMLSEKGFEALKQARQQWLSQPLQSIGIRLHIQKLDLMVDLFAYAVRQMEQLGFANANVFNPATYFNPPHNDLSTAARWEASFKQHFSIPVTSALGLLGWAQGALEAAQQKYGSLVRA